MMKMQSDKTARTVFVVSKQIAMNNKKNVFSGILPRGSISNSK